MARTPKPNPHKKQTVGNAIAPEDFVAEEEKPRSKSSTLPKAQFENLIRETDALKRRNAWAEFTPKNFVGLYCLLHAHVYGVMPDEVRQHYRAAVGKAMLMRKHEFSGDNNRMIHFIRWVWQREAKREANRDDDSNFRIGWRLQFAATFLSDYRVARARKGKKVQ